jgi:hypothetical protein
VGGVPEAPFVEFLKGFGGNESVSRGLSHLLLREVLATCNLDKCPNTVVVMVETEEESLKR